MSAHLHVVILYIIAMQIINLQSTTRMYQNIFCSSLHFFNKSEIIQITSIYNFKKVTFVPLFVCYPRFSSLWPAFMLTVHINAFYNECVHGREEHAT